MVGQSQVGLHSGVFRGARLPLQSSSMQSNTRGLGRRGGPHPAGDGSLCPPLGGQVEQNEDHHPQVAGFHGLRGDRGVPH